MNKKTTLIVLIAILSFSCSCNKNTKPSSEVNVENNKNHDWIYGKTFTQEGVAYSNPELGGLNFLRFVSKEQLELKTGDIITLVKAEIIGDVIIITDKMNLTNQAAHSFLTLR